MIWSALIYTSLYIFIIWLSLAVTIGIFYCADLAEEHPTLFGKIIRYSIWGVLVVHLVLFFEELPYSYICVGIVAHVCYYQLLKDFPRIQGISNPWLVGSLVLLVIDNACWLWYFYYHYFTMMEILCFGQILLWLVPFLYMISLSVNDNVLPGTGSYGTGGGMGASKGSNVSLKTLFAYFGFGQTKDQKAPANKPYYSSNHQPPAQSSHSNYGGYGGGASHNNAASASYAAPVAPTANMHMTHRGSSSGMGQGYAAPMPGNSRGGKYD
mmetsp:Transcript_24295/g.43088  ORF Transcript_24295/g.43088 Transcript_24295/m.43088 type:complete len:268 (+) Transcript_24295:171-974(+)|eukprot:CAMPEP_0197527700 /NCGR_PEP_ID=MMETSP1318-20131121/22609_1 /TAXON_ID=552666 /ORGANISM="Partenskyella glossopodia, Strain RCC365" /LENGTH=267 /DNA_ID=CAMNT_0043082479 /DNA_START=102 /DNA_END=905 /DNA_ORIENTATION=-